MAINPEHGVIMILNAKGPSHMPKGPRGNDVVPLQYLSDVAFLTWQKLCDDRDADLAGIKYFFMSTVVNEAAQNVAASLLHVEDLERSTEGYPGTIFSRASGDFEALEALAGSPLGTAVARFLIDHKQTLGSERRIESVRLWTVQPTPVALCMLFTLSDPPAALMSDPGAASETGKFTSGMKRPGSPLEKSQGLKTS